MMFWSLEALRIAISSTITSRNYSQILYEFNELSEFLQYFPELLSIYNPKNNMNESVAVSGAAIQVNKREWLDV